jgi:hypothetical protein
MNKKGLDYLQNAKTYEGRPVKNWLDDLLQNPATVFCFGTEHYKLTGELYFWAWYKNGEAWKFFEFWPRERQYIAEQKYPDTQKIIDAYNEAEKKHSSEGRWDFADLLPSAKIEEGLRQSLNTMAELSLIGAIYDEQHATK